MSHMGVGTWSYKGMIRGAKELECSKARIHSRELDKSEDKTERTNIATNDTRENKIDASIII